MEQQELTDEQKQFQDDQLKKGVASEEMINTPGWGYVKGFYEEQLKAFVNRIFTEGKPLTEYEGQRSELLGIKKLINDVDWSIKQVQQFRKNDKTNGSTSE